HNTSCRFKALHPNHHDARANPVEFRRLASRCPRRDPFNHSFTQVHRVRLRHCPSQSESMLSDSRIDKLFGNPSRFKPNGKCSSNVRDVHPCTVSVRTVHTPIGVYGCTDVRCVFHVTVQTQSIPSTDPAPNLVGDSLSNARLNATRLAVSILMGSVPSTT